MQTWDVPLRIVRTRFKLLYFAAWVATSLVEGLLFRLFVPELQRVVLGELTFIALVFVAVRSFRGASEPVDPPRAWWRMTGTVRSSVILAVLMVWSSASLLTSALGWPHHSRLTWVGRFDEAFSSVEYLALAVLYVNSAVRLHRSPDPAAQKPVALADPLEGLD